jgi:hypothetical protein
MINTRHLFSLCAAAALLAGHAGATGIENMNLPPIPPAPAKVDVDGKLGEWRGISGFNEQPLYRITASAGDKELAELLANPPSVMFKSCYDSDALYVALDWKDQKPGTNTTAAGDAANWSKGGEGFELHVLTDRVLHLACWPAAGGVAVMARYGDDTAWQDVSKSVTAAGAMDGADYAQELRIPWSAITSTGKLPPDGKLEWGADFAWNALPPSMVEKARQALFSSTGWAQGYALNFLTARPELITKGYMPGAENWGTLALGATPAGDTAIKQANGNTSITSLPVASAQTPPATDGSLDGWDPQLFQTATYLGALFGDRYSCKIAAQSDADNLYIAAHFASPGPSNLKSESTQEGYNGGDALQVRLSDGKNKVNLCAWYDTRAGKPALTADGVDLPNHFILQQGAKEAFKPDGKGGFVQVLALPWKVLLGGAPGAKSVVHTTLQLWFADLSPIYSAHSTQSLEKRAALSVAYKMPKDGQLTLGLYDKNGQLLKWLAQDDFRYAGENKEAWDGLDQWRNPVPAGSYVLKGLYHAPLSADYKVTVANPGTPPWPTPDGKGDWIGDESDPQGVATDGKWVYLASPGAEKGFWLIGVDENGQRQWGIPASPAEPRSVALSVDGDYLYAMYSGPTPAVNLRGRGYQQKSDDVEQAVLVCYDKKTGKAARFTIDTPRLRVATAPYREAYTWLDDLRNSKGFTPAVYGGKPRYASTDVGESTYALGMAAVGDKVYVSLLYDNKIIVVDAVTGKPTGEEIPLNAPAGLYAPDDKTLLAVSGTQVVKIDLANKTTTPLITSGLSAPFGVTTDKAGNIYVSDWGSSFQVKAFDASGKLLHAIGKEGGRPWVGKWDPNGMLLPRGIAVTDEGKLWVAEDDGSPGRVSVWNAQTGALLKDYIGPTGYGGGTFFAIDPKDKTIVHAAGATFKVDYDKNTYTPLAIDFRRQSRDDPFTPDGRGEAWGHAEIRYRDGKEYFITNVGGGELAIFERKGDHYRAVAAIGHVRPDPTKKFDGTERDAFDSDVGGHHLYPGYYPEFFAGHSGDNFTWSDTDGDNLVQADEMRWHKTQNVPYQDGIQPGFGLAWGGIVLAPDWSVIAFGTYRDRSAFFRIPLKGWTPKGAPIYDIADAKPFGFDTAGAGIQGIYVTKDNKLIASHYFEGGNDPRAFTCYDLQGHQLWAIARPIPFSEPTELQPKRVHAQNAVYDFNIPGLGDVFGTWLWHGACRPYLITTDGLYVGTLLDYTLLGPTALWGESYTYYYQAPDGTPYVVNGANQAEHILQIKGLEADSTGRFEAPYELGDADVKLAASMREVPEVKSAPKPVLAATWLAKAPVVDGDLSDWKMPDGATLDGGNGHTAEVALGRDAANLYLAYRVHEPNPMRNGGSDWQTLFTTGDCVDLMLQTDPKADPHRRAAAAGDERLLFSEFQGQPIAVLYRPVAPGAGTPVSLSTASFDEIIKLDSAKVAIQRDATHGFYTLEASVPLKDIHLDPKSADDVRGDVGVVYADDSGHSRSQRLYYYNQQTAMVNDLPTEARLQPDQWGKIAMPLGPNLIQNGGFEEPFVDSAQDDDKGWYVSMTRNGAYAETSDESPFSGHQSLLLESEPVVYPPEMYANPDQGAFARSANGGKGDAAVEVRQRVPVIGGHEYSIRFQFRSQDYPRANTRPGHPRGWAGAGVRIECIWPPPAPRPANPRVSVVDMYNLGGCVEPTPDWFTSYNAHRSIIGPAAPNLAPPGATGADLVIGMRNSFDARPKFFFDNFEFVDVTSSVAIN